MALRRRIGGGGESFDLTADHTFSGDIEFTGDIVSSSDGHIRLFPDGDGRVKMGSGGVTETALVQVQAHNSPIFRVTDLSDNAKIEFTLGNWGEDAIMMAYGAPMHLKTVSDYPIEIKTNDTLRWVFKEGGDVSLKQDSKKLFFGAGDDASIQYDGSNCLINTEEVEVAAGKGNLGINTTTLDGAATGCIAISNGTEPGAHTDNQVYIGAKDSAGTGTETLSTLQLFTEEAVDETALDAVGSLTTRLPVWINGDCYWLYLKPV